MTRPHPSSTLFPYTTLFRSRPISIGSASSDQHSVLERPFGSLVEASPHEEAEDEDIDRAALAEIDRKSTRLNSSHQIISYAVFCLKKKNKTVMVENEEI